MVNHFLTVAFTNLFEVNGTRVRNFSKNASVGCQPWLRMGKDKSRDGKIYLSFVVAIP